MMTADGNLPAVALTGACAIVGGGLIGQSWAALFMAHGHAVRLWDPVEAVRGSAPTRIAAMLAQLAELNGHSATTGALTICPTLEEAVRDAALIQENGPEKISLKRELYGAIETVVDDCAIIASSTSSLTWSQLSPDMRVPSRLITAHPFNPPHLMPLVEIYAADDAVRLQADAFYGGLGRVTVHLHKDAVGHIANRLASALWREAVNLVAEGIADVPAVDAALVNGPGLRWSVVGAHLAYHLGGGTGGIAHYLEHLGPSQEKRWSTLGHPSLTPDVCSRLIAGIADETGGASIAELEARRDRALIATLKLRTTD